MGSTGEVGYRSLGLHLSPDYMAAPAGAPRPAGYPPERRAGPAARRGARTGRRFNRFRRVPAAGRGGSGLLSAALAPDGPVPAPLSRLADESLSITRSTPLFPS